MYVFLAEVLKNWSARFPSSRSVPLQPQKPFAELETSQGKMSGDHESLDGLVLDVAQLRAKPLEC